MQLEQLGQAGIILAASVYIIEKILALIFNFLNKQKEKANGHDDGNGNGKIKVADVFRLVDTINRIAESQSGIVETLEQAVERQGNTAQLIKEIHDLIIAKDDERVPLIYGRRHAQNEISKELQNLIVLEKKELEKLDEILRFAKKEFVG